jgi:hypothetical protein
MESTLDLGKMLKLGGILITGSMVAIRVYYTRKVFYGDSKPKKEEESVAMSREKRIVFMLLRASASSGQLFSFLWGIGAWEKIVSANFKTIWLSGADEQVIDFQS